MVNIKKNKMDINTIIILMIIGLFTGALGGMVGIGGGVVLVPALIYFLGFSQLNAQGTSLALIMFPVGIFAVVNYYKQGHIDFNVVFYIAIGFIIGSFLGSKFAMSLPKETIRKIFALLMIVIAIKMLFFENKKSVADNRKVATVESENPANQPYS
jgi:hypothetical protein